MTNKYGARRVEWNGLDFAVRRRWISALATCAIEGNQFAIDVLALLMERLEPLMDAL